MARTTGMSGIVTRPRKRASGSQEGDDSDLEKHAFPKRPRVEGKTDLRRWRMRDDESRHTWHYMPSDQAAKAWPQSLADKYFLNLPLV